jgi:hypothetical protein
MPKYRVTRKSWSWEIDRGRYEAADPQDAVDRINLERNVQFVANGGHIETVDVFEVNPDGSETFVLRVRPKATTAYIGVPNP